MHATPIFNTVPKHDYLGLIKSHSFKDIACFLNLNKNDISKAFNIPKSSVRYDNKVSKEVAKRLTEIAVTCEFVAEFFDGDAKKQLYGSK